jgi:C4-dicarboxylate transporter DctM subunit
MKKSGYDSAFAGAVQAAGGSIGVIIPPSIPMIIFGYLTGASIGRLFAAGILPGILIGVSLVLVSTLISKRRAYGRAAGFSLVRIWVTLRQALLALGAPAIILGGILGGVFTATESAAVAVVYALLVGLFVYREIAFRDLPRLFIEGCVIAAVVMFIIAAASIFSWIAAIESLPQMLAGSLLGLSRDPVVLLLLLNLILLLAGTFVETTAALILLVPMLAGMQPQLGIDLVQLGVIVVTNLAIGMLTPPLGICLIVSGAISGDSIGPLSRQALPFVLILIVDLMIITFYSPMTMFFARMVH